MRNAWADLRSGHVELAHEAFASAIAACPDNQDAALGLAYASFRLGDVARAEALFLDVVRDDPQAADALLGAGIISWQRGDVGEARQYFERTLFLDPENDQARAYLDRFPEPLEEPRDSLVVPDTLTYFSRVTARGFEVREGDGWRPFYVKGINIGAALPGNHPSEFPDSATYANWLSLIGAMGANTVRVYTIHPPHFYAALAQYNEEHPGSPLRMFHGVWAELPPDEVSYHHEGWLRSFYREIHWVIDLIHGRADLPVRPGKASGSYTTDVSRWTVGLILGREWEAHSVDGYNKLAVSDTTFAGRFVEVDAGTPIDVWLARAVEEAASYETETYRTQRPVAYTNWPPTDPMRHPTELSTLEELAIRQAYGSDEVQAHSVLVGADAVSLDPTLLRPTERLPAGYFASYHVYPYSPDFMVNDPDLYRATSPYGSSSYWGYLLRLRQHHDGLAVLISEYGIPASLGIAHLQPQGWHHGGLSESRAAEVNARMTLEIEAAGMAGGILFEWIDEWFKKAWNTDLLEVPRERDRMWYNRMDAEEHYGVIAVEPRTALSGETLADRRDAWNELPPLIRASGGGSLRAAVDEAYVWLLIDEGEGGDVDEAMVGFDVIDPAAGDFRWPGGAGELPVGVEFVLTVNDEGVRLLADPFVNPLLVVDTLSVVPEAVVEAWPPIVRTPPGFFQGRFTQENRIPLRTTANDDGQYEGLMALTNRMRLLRDSTAFAAMGYDWGILPGGPSPDGLWEKEGRLVEVRLPWQLLNVADPSSRQVLSYDRYQADGQLGTRTVDGIGMMLGFRTGPQVRYAPASRDPEDVPKLSWTPWEVPSWTTRPRPTFSTVRRAWASIPLSSVVLED